MDSLFYTQNRKTLYDSLPEDTLLLIFAGDLLRKTADEDYLFYTDTNFLYLTGIEQRSSLLAAEKVNGEVREILFMLPPDLMAERWTGERIKPEKAHELSGISDIRSTDEIDEYITSVAAKVQWLAFDIDNMKANNPTQLSFRAHARELCSRAGIYDVRPQITAQRTIKRPCEIEAMRQAELLTREGILAMMRASKPGMYEYQYKAEWDYALLSRGCKESAFPPIVSTGKSNFIIHYYDYSRQAQDGDMILNDVGGKFDHMHTDVSRGWPCNGKFSDRQRALYECAYETSNHLFEVLKPGLPMPYCDAEVHRYCAQLLCDIGLLDKPENEKKYMWHGGAHHVGFDTHDMVNLKAYDGLMAPGMVFCVDVGIYVPEWGIGFRLEDNCLITEDGCENLSVVTPRAIEDIEAIMGKR